jgi:hypothetical protein
MLQFIKNGTANIIKADAEKNIISLSLVSQWGFVFFGQGGHAKSVLTEKVKSLIMGVKWNIKTMGSGNREDELKGGIDLNALEGLTADGVPTAKRIKYLYEYSPLNCDILGLEEGFDMPDAIGANFKDWITSKRFRDGNEEFALPLKMVYVTTNREPAELAQKGEWVEALMQRFPLQHRSVWESYTPNDYCDLFNAPKATDEFIEWSQIVSLQNDCKNVVVSNGMKKLLAELLGKASSTGTPISPRTAMLAMQICKAQATINGSKSLEKEALTCLRYINGLSDLGRGIEREISDADARAKAEEKMNIFTATANSLFADLATVASPIKALQISLKLRKLADELSQVSVTDNLTYTRNSLRDSINNAIPQANDKALTLTTI